MKMIKLIALMTTFLFGSFMGTAAGLDPLVSGTVFTGLAMLSTMPQGALLSALNLSDLTTKLGDYHREHRNILISEILLDESFDEKFEVLDDITDELPLPSMNITDIVKPANPVTFSPTSNALVFGARVLKVRGCKVDLQIVPQQLEKTWLGKMKRANDPWDMPFEQFIWSYIIQKAKENIHLQGIFRGEYDATGTTPIDTMDGFLKLVADEIGDSNITPVLTGPITENNVVASLLKVYDSLGEAYKNQTAVMKVNPQIYDWYSRKFAPVLNSSLVATDVAAMLANPLTRSMPLSGTNAILQREPGLGQSQRVMCSLKENFVLGVDTLNNYSFDVQKFDRSIKILIDFKVGVQFKEIHGRALAVNDVDAPEGGE
jgi:hypothetical protein